MSVIILPKISQLGSGVASGEGTPHYDSGNLQPSASPRLRSAILGLLFLVTLASALGTALAPYLLVKSPLLLVAVSPAAHHVVLAAATVEPLPLIVVATLRRVLTGLGAYGLGYLYGRAAIQWLEQRHPRLARLVLLVERLFARVGVALLIVAPAPTIAVLAGAARSRLSVFLIALTLGHTLWNIITQHLGDSLARSTDLFTAFLDEHLLESTLVCVAVVVLQQAFSRLLRRKRQPAP
jgi:membrane protein DedA with SNARE-associated domain